MEKVFKTIIRNNLCTVVGTIAQKESTLGQARVTLSALEASDMKVLVLNAEHLTAAFFLATLTKCFH